MYDWSKYVNIVLAHLCLPENSWYVQNGDRDSYLIRLVYIHSQFLDFLCDALRFDGYERVD
jgi:hypothetical protein